jgi:cytochrome P450
MSTNADPVNWFAILSAPEVLQNPYPTLARLRERGSVQRDPASGVFFVLSHEAFSQISKSPCMGRDTRKWKDGWDRPGAAAEDPVGHRLLTEFSPQMINVDPPDHARMRSVYEPVFHPASVARMTQAIEAETMRLIESMPAHGEVEMIGAFAAPLPLRVLRNLFEMPPEMDDQMSQWSSALIKIGDIMMTQDQKKEALATLSDFKSYLTDYLVARRAAPGDGLIDKVIAAQDSGVLDEEETLINLVSMLVAGHETTVSLLGNGLLALVENPGELTRLRDDRSLVRTAVEEFMRYYPGGNMILRVALEDTEVDGVHVPAGSLLVGLIGAVNRDPQRFEEPDQLRIDRRPNAHFTFGGGAHFCIGAPLARLEAQIGFNRLLDRFASLKLAGRAVWRTDRMNARSLDKLPLLVG